MRVTDRRPERPFDPGLQHERTTLAWERTAFSVMVIGVILARYGVDDGIVIEAVVGSLIALVGACCLLWAGHNYVALHGPLDRGQNPVHPRAAAALGTVAVVGATTALLSGLRLALT